MPAKKLTGAEFAAKYGRDECNRVAREVGTGEDYFYYQIVPGKKACSLDMAQKLVKASKGRLDLVSLMQRRDDDVNDIRLSDLTEAQRGHLAWRLVCKTGCPPNKAEAIASGRRGDMGLIDIFMKYGDRNLRGAKIHAHKVAMFR